MNRLLFVFFFFLITNPALSQQRYSKKKEKILKAVYSAVMNDFCKEKTWGYVMEDSTRNRQIAGWDYDRYMEWLLIRDRQGRPAKLQIDSLWLPFLQTIDTRRTGLKTVKVPRFETISTLYLLHRDTINALKDPLTVGGGPYERLGWMQARISVSDILFSDKKDMAIVEFNQTCGSLCGTGSLYLLERKNKHWEVIFRIEIWQS